MHFMHDYTWCPETGLACQWLSVPEGAGTQYDSAHNQALLGVNWSGRKDRLV